MALLIAAIGVGAAAAFLAVTSLPALASWSASPWVPALMTLVAVCLPLTAAVFVAGRAASGVGTARATGIRRWHATDVVLGFGLGLVLRAGVELITPTVGSPSPPFASEDAQYAQLAAIVIAAVGAALISPVVEELFFRGLVQRALTDGLAHAGRIFAAAAAVAVSTAAFVAVHAVAAGGQLSVGVLIATAGVGIGCGIATAMTGRLGAALATHVVFNAVGVALLLG